MTFAAAALLGLTISQPLGPDYHAMNSRTIKLPIEYKKDRKSIRQVLLYVARNGENTWYQEGFVTPDKDDFVYVAKDDGVYWFKMVIEDMKGNKDPADITRDPPDLKMLIDTVAPVVRVTNAKRNGEEIVVTWLVDDKFPNDAETKVHFRATANANGIWQEVTLPSNSRSGVKFPCGTSESITVKITAMDFAGNKTEIMSDFPVGSGSTSARLESQPPVTPAGVGTAQLPPPMGLAPVVPPAAPITPDPVAPLVPPAAIPPMPVLPTPPIQPIVPPYQSPVVTPPSSANKALNVFDPKAAPQVALPTHSGATPVGAWNGGTDPTVELTRAQVINYPRFDLGFDVEQRGPSGISRVDLWVTRDDGRTWSKWSQHDGKGGAIRVVLDVRENAQLEGNYGFRLVPVSGAGLSEREPAAGDAPDMRVVLDITAPHLDLFPPTSDPNAVDTLVIQWKATDRNFSEDPISLEWSDSPTGPWKQLDAAPVAKRLANTGQYGWRIGAGLPARVYLKASARDAAGNVKEVITREPILVDLTKPRAKISGIVAPASPRP